MNWPTIQENVGNDATFMADNGEYVKIRIQNADETEDGNKWFTYSFLDHKEWSPVFMRVNLNYANCCWTDTSKGYFSTEIKKSLFIS